MRKPRWLLLLLLTGPLALLLPLSRVAGAQAGAPDFDADGVPDATDNCPFYPNPNQSDVDHNGRGDLCECGDQNGDGRVDVRDLVAINVAIFDPPLKTPLCDGNNDDQCNVSDIIAANRTIYWPRSASCRRTTAAPKRPVVQVNVAVAQPGAAGSVLSYRWRSTDGYIVDANAPSTTWSLPAGPGLHFAYVLVSNGMGGYTERRVAVSTDAIGIPIEVPGPRTYAAPPAPEPPGNSLYMFLWGDVGALPLTASNGDPVEHDSFLPDTLVRVRNTVTGELFPPTGPARTDLRGRVAIHNLPPSDATAAEFYSPLCFTPGTSTAWDPCVHTQELTSHRAEVHFISHGPVEEVSPDGALVGRIRLSDDSICGMKNEFFGTEATATATLLDASGNTIGVPVRLSSDGDFSFLQDLAGATSVRITCEAATPVSFPISTSSTADPISRVVDGVPHGDLGINTLSGLQAPVVSGMTATLGTTPVGLFLPPPSGAPSDAVPDAEHFFTYKGIDTRLSACRYYQTIGAVQSCGPQGQFSGAIDVEDWKRTAKIGGYATAGAQEYEATFINRIDLNLTRNHHSITYGPDHTAAYVCNHLGPPSLDSTQAEVDTAVDNAVHGRNLVACVMMDHISTPGVNGGKPYTRFLIFGPSGELLPSINLDGRREKFVPGICVACHGGDRYAGRFPEDGSGFADIGAHFLPYDVGNFAFSSAAGLTRSEQELAIYHLNQNLLNSGPTQAARDLINGWYAASTTQDVDYLPPSWAGQGFDEAYHKVYAHYCRTCHVNMTDDPDPNAIPYRSFNFDLFDNASNLSFESDLSCSNTAYHGQHRKWAMPNSLVTFNRFWSTKGTPDDLTALFAASLGVAECDLVHLP